MDSCPYLPLPRNRPPQDNLEAISRDRCDSNNLDAPESCDPPLAGIKCSLPDLVTTSMAASIHQPRNLFDTVVVLDQLPESSGDDDDGDHLFLLPDCVLAMDSISFREDVADIAPSFLPQQHSPHNSLDSSDSNRSLRLADDTEGLRLARASSGCRTLWLCEAGLIGSTSSNSSSGHLLVDDATPRAERVPTHDESNAGELEQQVSSQRLEAQLDPDHELHGHSHDLDGSIEVEADYQNGSTLSVDLVAASSTPKRPLSRKSSAHRSRDQLSLSNKEREDRVKKIKETHEDERRKKLEELKNHALAAQKFREQQELERRRHFEQLRSRDSEKLSAVAERRKAIEFADRERKEAMLKKAIEREEKILDKRREQQAKMTFAFGSSTPRSLHPNLGSSTDIWGASTRRSTSSSNVHGNLMSQSMYSPGPTANRKSVEREMDDSMNKRTSSVHGLDKNGDGEDSGLPTSSMSQSFCLSGSSGTFSAHRRRTDLMPTITPGMIARESLSRSSTPAGTKRSTPGRAVSMSRLDQLSKPRLMHANPQPNNPNHHHNSNRQVKGGKTNSHNHGGGGRGEVPFRQGGMSASVSMGHLNRPPSANSSNRSLIKRRPSHLAQRPPRPRPEGISRESSSMHQSRPPSAMSTESNGVVRMRRAPARRTRPISIATTGVMSTSMIDTRRTTHAPSSASKTNQKSHTPTRMTRSNSTDKEDELKSASLVKSPSSHAVGSSQRRTPAQVKAEAAAKKAKSPVKAPSASTPLKSPVGKKDFVSSSAPTEDRPPKSASPDITPKKQTEEATPDVIATGEVSRRNSSVKERSSSQGSVDEGENSGGPGTPSKKIISSAEEAKARLAEKRREMKEKMEREAELERQRLAEEDRIEEEKRRVEEEEERRAIEEAEKLAAEAKILENERLEKAIEEAQQREEDELKRKEEEEKLRQEKDEADRKAREEAEQKEKELEEKRQKEQVERLERKKRLEEIMSRTRGNNKSTPTSTPKKEPTTPSSESQTANGDGSFISVTPPVEHSSEHAPPSSDSEAAQVVQPDLIGDLLSNNNKQSHNSDQSLTSSSDVIAENEKNQVQAEADGNHHKEQQLLFDSPVQEKGSIDTQIKEDAATFRLDSSNGPTNGNDRSLNISEFESLNAKKSGADLVLGSNHSEFDQIIDLRESGIETSHSELTAPPIIAFETEAISVDSSNSSTNFKLDANSTAADLLS